MKFHIPCINPRLEASKLLDGGSIWLNNIACALRGAGHEAELVDLTAHYEADYVIIQSEWITMPNVMDYQGRGGKIICLLGHFIDHVYPRIDLVKSLPKLLITTWTGECTEGFNAKFLPHGYSEENDLEGIERKGSVVWAGNSYALRGEGWFNELDVFQIKDTPPQNLPAIYRGADVCLGLHGPFQQNIVSSEPSRIADKPGTMINERFWNVLGCGGLLISDWVPQMSKFFNKEDLIIGETKEEYQELVNYYKDHKEEGLNKLKKARELVREKHSYKARIEQLLQWLP